MEFSWTVLPLYSSWDYEYRVELVGKAYNIRVYYSDRTKKWSFDLSEADGDFIRTGTTLLNKKMNLIDVLKPNSFFYLEPVSEDINEAQLHPDMIHKYFNFFFIEMEG